MFVKTLCSNQLRVYGNAVFRYYSSSKMPQFETLAVSEPRKHVFQVSLNRPAKLNSFSHNMWQEIMDCFRALSDNSECRVVVLTGEGKHFTAGIDLNSFIEKGAEAADFDDVARKARYFSKMIKMYQDSMSSVEDCIKPVIAVPHSACIGAGVDLITAADIRYCTEDSWFTIKEVDIGLAADVGTLQRLPKAIGSASIARELALTARKFDAKEALQIGLVSRVYPDRDTAIKEVLEIASNIAAKSPVAVQATKQNMVYSQSRTVEDGLMHIRLLNQANLQSEDLSKSAIAAATKSKDPPEFENL